MRNLIVSSFTILLLIFSSCEEDIVKSFENTANKTIELSSESDFKNLDREDDFIESERGEQTLVVDEIYLDCIADSKFVVRATFDDQTKSISFEYYTNSANTSPVSPVSINWTVDDGSLDSIDSGNETATEFYFNRDYNVKISINFEDSTTFEDQFCVNIDEADASAFKVCSEHESTVGCSEYDRGGNKRGLVVVDIINDF